MQLIFRKFSGAGVAPFSQKAAAPPEGPARTSRPAARRLAWDCQKRQSCFFEQIAGRDAFSPTRRRQIAPKGQGKPPRGAPPERIRPEIRRGYPDEEKTASQARQPLSVAGQPALSPEDPVVQVLRRRRLRRPRELDVPRIVHGAPPLVFVAHTSICALPPKMCTAAYTQP